MTSASGIEIIVHDCPPDRLAAWLATVAGVPGDPIEAGEALLYHTRRGPVVVQPGVLGLGTSIWFNGPDLPWTSDAECARQASAALGCTVLCDPGPGHPQVPPLTSIMLEVSTTGERLFVPDEA